MSALRTSVFQTARILPSHASRLLHQTAVSSYAPPPPYKDDDDDMDRTSLRPRARENTQSGTDDGAAAAGAAFDGRETAPEAERDAAAAKHGEEGGSPLDVSPADHKFAKGEGEGGAEEKPRPQQGGKGKRSGKGDTPKAGKVN